MSGATWLKEHYPIPASEVSGQDAVQHSLQKWRGLRPEALDKHHCFLDRLRVKDKSTQEEVLFIDSGSCSLCTWYANHVPRCVDCPLYKKRDWACDMGLHAPWITFTRDSDPEPMIRILESCL